MSYFQLMFRIYCYVFSEKHVIVIRAGNFHYYLPLVPSFGDICHSLLVPAYIILVYYN